GGIEIYRRLAQKQPEKYIGEWVGYKMFIWVLNQVSQTSSPNPEKQAEKDRKEALEALKLIEVNKLDNLYLTKSFLNYSIVSSFVYTQNLDSVIKYLNRAMAQIEKYPHSNYHHKPMTISAKYSLALYKDVIDGDFYEVADDIYNELNELPLPDLKKIESEGLSFLDNNDLEFLSEKEYFRTLNGLYNYIFVGYEGDISYRFHKKIYDSGLPDKYYKLLKITYLTGDYGDKIFYAHGMSHLAGMEYRKDNYEKAAQNIHQAVLVYEKDYRNNPHHILSQNNLITALINKAFYSIEAELKKETIESSERAIEVINSLSEEEHIHLFQSEKRGRQVIKNFKDLIKEASRLKD
ncbi:MAG: hypothetical protein KDD63_21805, partial [Bacteroidetes bacterium]|nr:hypothetical protein [Bacteroidota bacterium]